MFFGSVTCQFGVSLLFILCVKCVREFSLCMGHIGENWTCQKVCAQTAHFCYLFVSVFVFCFPLFVARIFRNPNSFLALFLLSCFQQNTSRKVQAVSSKQ